MPEVIGNIVNLADSCTQASAARISKRWSEGALDCIYRHMDSITPLLKLLGPMRRVPYPTMFVSSTETISAW